MQSQKHFVRKVKKSNSIKCIFSNKSKFWPGKSKKSKLNMELRKVKFFHNVYVKEVKGFSLRSQRVNLLSSKTLKSEKVGADPTLLVLAVNTTGMFSMQIPQKFTELSENWKLL